MDVAPSIESILDFQLDPSYRQTIQLVTLLDALDPALEGLEDLRVMCTPDPEMEILTFTGS